MARQTFVQADICLGRHLSRQTFVQADIHLGRHSYRWTFIQVDIHLGGHSSRWSFIQADIRLGRHSSRQTFIQTDIRLGRHSSTLTNSSKLLESLNNPLFLFFNFRVRSKARPPQTRCPCPACLTPEAVIHKSHWPQNRLSR